MSVTLWRFFEMMGTDRDAAEAQAEQAHGQYDGNRLSQCGPRHKHNFVEYIKFSAFFPKMLLALLVLERGGLRGRS